MELPALIPTYLVGHGIATLGAIILFLIRNEHRITKVETAFNLLKESHDTLTNHGTKPHADQP